MAAVIEPFKAIHERTPLQRHLAAAGRDVRMRPFVLEKSTVSSTAANAGTVNSIANR
jgi:hypothetical protein